MSPACYVLIHALMHVSYPKAGYRGLVNTKRYRNVPAKLKEVPVSGQEEKNEYENWPLHE